MDLTDAQIPSDAPTRLGEALAYAADAHQGQTRTGTDIPYIAHLLAVTALVIEAGGDEDTALAGALHDVAEDQGGRPRLADVRARFGDRVAGLVAALSDTLEDPKPPWRARKETYVAHLAGAPRDVLMVSAADKLHNLRAIVADYREVGDDVWQRFNPDSDTLWYYGALADVFRDRLGGPLSRDIDVELATLHTLVGAAPE